MSSKNLALLGTKVGMTHFFAEGGKVVPATMIQLGPCVVTQKKTKEKDGYDSVQIGYKPKKAHRLNKPEKGHFSKAAQGGFYELKEVRLDGKTQGSAQDNELIANLNTGDVITAVDVFEVGDKIDVSGTSKGRGFSGVVRRYRMAGQTATRGTHEARRNVGSVGCRKSPGRIFKNKRMPGRMGGKKVSVLNLKVLKVIEESSVILVKGSIPGAKGMTISVKHASKKKAKR